MIPPTNPSAEIEALERDLLMLGNAGYSGLNQQNVKGW